MAIEEITFYNTNGDEINISNIVNQMINYYGMKLEVGETKVTDFNEGSEIRNILEAFAIAIYALLDEQHEATRIAFISTSYGAWLDRIGELPFIDLPRISAEYAQGEVTFTLATAQAEDYTIPAETMLAVSSTGLEFITTTDCLIYAGETTGTASAECLSTGSDGNVQALAIDTVSSEFVDAELVSVSNVNGFGGGADEEDDEIYRQRLLDNVQADGFGTQGYYVKLCESVDGVHDVLLVDATGYTKKAIVNGDVKPTSDGILLDVLSKLSDVRNKVLNHSFTVDKPAYSSGHTLAITMNVKTPLSTTTLNAVMQGLFNGGDVERLNLQGMSINQSLTKEEIVRTLETFADVVSVTSVKESGTEISTLTPSSNDVLTLTSVSWTQNEV